MAGETARRHHHAALRAPVVHQHDRVHVGPGPRFDLLQVVSVDPADQVEQLGRFFRQVHQRPFHRPDERQALERTDQGPGQDEPVGVATERVDGVAIDGQRLVRRAEALEVGPLADERFVGRCR